MAEVGRQFDPVLRLEGFELFLGDDGTEFVAVVLTSEDGKFRIRCPQAIQQLFQSHLFKRFLSYSNLL